MYEKHIEHIERVEGNLHVGDNIYAKPVFDGDYSKCDCEDKVYNYRPVWVGVVMYAVVLAFWIWNAISLLASFHSGIVLHHGVSSGYVLAENVAFAIAMALIYWALPFLGDMFKIYFAPKEGVMVVGGEVIPFSDVKKMEMDGKLLYIMHRSGKKRVIAFRGAEYVYTCITSMWGAQCVAVK